MFRERKRDFATRSILMESAAHQAGFLPNEYRLANTFASINRQRSELRSSPKANGSTPRIPPNTSPRFDAFGNLTTMNKLAEQRLILREKANKRKFISSPLFDKSLIMSDGDFATDIPNAIEMILKSSKSKPTMELNLFEALKRERLEQSRYRLLPINRAPNA